MSTKFFTNRGENTLINKFKGIFENTKVQAFDALVGYFRASGYFRIRAYLKDVEQIRILVGIDVDHLISEAARKGLAFNFNTDETKGAFIERLKEDISKCAYKKDVETGILEFIQDIDSGKIQIKAHPNKNIHAKIYIFRPQNWNEHNSGKVITGSSNLSKAGIEKNFEFNVLLPYYEDVVFASTTFNNLWEEAVEILPETVQDVQKETYLNDEFTPFEIYIKLLIEHFGKSIEYDPESITDMPKGYKQLAYQIDAVNDGYTKLLKHSGFLLADVVGLGKTVIATIIAKKFYFANGYRTKILVVAPPTLETAWRETIRDFDVPNVKFISNGSLHNLKHPEDYDLIIVDEAHKFRSDASNRFDELQKICKTERKNRGNVGGTKKKVILISATPLNNKPTDIRNLLYLFQDARDSTLEVGNLQAFFAPLIKEYDELIKLSKDFDFKNSQQIIGSAGIRNIEDIKKKINKIAEKIRHKVLESIIVRRTRTDILNTPHYVEDMKKQGMAFPEIQPPKPILYQLDAKTNKLYDETLKALIKKLTYYRYQAIKFMSLKAKKQYTKATGIKIHQANLISDNLATIMKTLLVKRIDSSFSAFKKSLNKFHKANKAMLQMIDKGIIYIAPTLQVSDYILDDKEEELEKLLLDPKYERKIHPFDVDDFDEEFKQGIKSDHQMLSRLVEEWKLIKEDPKYDEFKSRFFNEPDKGDKLVVFSEAKDTTSYLADQLKEDGFSKILKIDSSNVKDFKATITENFDANIPIKEQKNDYDVIITTEVLAEGINLHRSHRIVNYDIPWNATRLMQRIGRVNRIGTLSDKIYISNFFPTERTDDEIELNKKAFVKLQSFHSALGEDSQIYSTEEVFKTFGLFEKIPEEEKDERVEYLNYLRKFREEQPEEYKRIKDKIPRRARCGRKNKAIKGQTVAYIKDKKRDAYYLVHSDNSIEELTFVEAARIYKAEFSERGLPLSSFHYEHVNKALENFEKEQDLSILSKKNPQTKNPTDRMAIRILKDMMRQDFASDEDKTWLKEALAAVQIGRFQNLPRAIKKLKDQSKSKGTTRLEEFEALMKMIKGYRLKDRIAVIEKKDTKAEKPQIIISESFIE